METPVCALFESKSGYYPKNESIKYHGQHHKAKPGECPKIVLHNPAPQISEGVDINFL